MENSYPWAKALNVSDIDLESWQEEIPPQAQLLNWCLDHEKINPQEYYDWAKEHYQLAMIAPDFFQNAPDLQLWKQIQSVANWSPNMVPIRQWDGVVFVACVEPQTQIPWSFPVQFLLAPRRDLLNYWMQLHSGSHSNSEDSKKTVQSPAAEKAPEPVAMQAQPVVEEKSKPVEMQAKPVAEEEKPAAVNESQSAVEVPDGFPSLDLDSHHTDATPEGLDLQPVSESSNDAPVGFDFDMGASETSKQEDDLFGGFDKIESKAAEGPSVDGLIDNQEQVLASPMEAFEAVQEPSEDIQSSFHNEEPETAQDLDEATAILNSTNVTQKQSTLIGELKTRYQNVMILKYDTNQWIPFDWDSGLNTNRQAVDVEHPSFLKVVLKSKKPYHGYLAENQFHQNLFQSWGLSSLPPHVTAVPVEDSSTKYIVVAIGDEGCAGYQMIHFVESAIKNNPFSEDAGHSASKAA